jgi:hypothetical protein
MTKKKQRQNRGWSGVYVPSQDLPPAHKFGIRPDEDSGAKIAVASVAIWMFFSEVVFVGGIPSMRCRGSAAEVQKCSKL